MANPGYGIRINHARCDAGLSQVELAAALHTVQPNLSRWERETACPSKATFEALGRVLGTSAEWLVWGGMPEQMKVRRAFNRYLLPAEAAHEISKEEHDAIVARNRSKRR